MKVKKKKKKKALKALSFLSQRKYITEVKSNKKKKKKKSASNKKKKNGKYSKSKKKNLKVKRKWWKRLLTLFLLLGILGVLGVAIFFGYIVISAPKFDTEAFKVNDQTVIYDINNNIIATIGSEKRESIEYADLPQVLIDAIVATEDSKFFQHNGVDLLRFTKATFLQLIGREEGGASTLTMQVAKNNLTQQGKQEKNFLEKIVRKFHDVYLAVFKIEKKYSKEKIFEFYVNSYYLGGSSYGVQTASKYYFNKDVSELTLPEAALIAGLFQSPGKDNPYYDIEAATKRRNIVLKLMERHNYITHEEYEYAQNITIESLLREKTDENNYQGFVDTVVDEVKEITNGLNPYTTPMKIYTTMEKSIQDGIDKIYAGKTSYKWKNNKVQAGIAVIYTQTGAIAAVGAGRNRTGINTFNYATMAKKQPGSTAKPIFAYGPAIENNNLSTYTLFNDESWAYSNGVKFNNWDNGYTGLITMRYALQYSRNVPAVKAIQMTGVANSQKFAHSLGLDVSLDKNSENYRIISGNVDNTINEAYAIGGVAEGFTPLEMAAAYATFSNGGYYIQPHSVNKIEFRNNNGETVEYKYTKTRVMKESTAYIINNILESATTSGFDGGAKISGSHIATKTGTSNYDTATKKKYNLPSNAVNDLWTIAYTSKYSVALWYGYKDASEGYNTGNGPKETLMQAVMKNIPKDTKGFKKPSTIVAAQVEVGTWPAQKPSNNTPASLISTEYFIRGTEPSETSPRFQNLANVKNLTYNKVGSNVSINWDYDTPEIFTEDYLNKYYKQSVFGKGTSKFVNTVKEFKLPDIRVSGSKKTSFSYGKIIYGIYKKDVNDTLTLIATTENKSYTLTPDKLNPTGTTTIVIKAEYKDYKGSSSSGLSIDLNNTVTPKKLVVVLNSTSETFPVGSFVETGFSSAYYDTQDVLNSISVKYQVTINSELKVFDTKEALTEAINKLPAGTYKITYIVTYESAETTVSKTIRLE